ncbi:molybdenum ABC transporter ATPase [Moraxella bovoculi]|uniref:Molybdenum ABC transporter ATPase n=1 Tax=Moraxella bovoculi TaxID=386891 RepID=A0AAC8PX43_9GAMM|nr:molybdenum ABC transporter ATPase [Moraxella bovoculi]AKG09101.1 molybdenum ABC transporter ATPase [Moraxella bovoculi]AKG10936.1 molybdenum ABC transporter ATPase [Moraxella bovoculi]AKG12928.1 molybdenum ABC transporter ATPase [Moraxella bovoculi]
MFHCQFRLSFGKKMLDAHLVKSAPVVGIFGRSGAGKSSILHALAGIITPTEGYIIIDGQVWFDDKTNLSPQSRRVGLVFQDAQLFPHKSVMDNLLFGYNNITPSDRRFSPDEIIELLKLDTLTHRHPKNLSGGEKQRVALGRALLYSPKLLLLDEPLSALDREHKDEILPFFEHIRDTLAIPMLYVSHDKSEIERLTDEMLYL